MNIRLLKREEIERDRWNGCVHYAPNGNLFGYHWYLDQVGKDWEALVEDEYHSVFPLVHRPLRFQGQALHQPDLIRELGIFSVRALSPTRINAFLEAIPEQYRKIDIRVNRQSHLPQAEDFAYVEHANYYLELNPSYEELSDQFSAHLFSQLDRAQEAGLLPRSSPKPEPIADFHKKHHPEADHHALMRVMYNLLHRGWGFASAVTDPEGNWLAADFFAYSHNRVMSLARTESPRGKEMGALAYLYNFLLRSHAGRPMQLDFNQPEADFAQSFGAKRSAFYQLQRDKRRFAILNF